MILNNITENLCIPANKIIIAHIKLKGLDTFQSYNSLSKNIISNIIKCYDPLSILIPTFTYSFAINGRYCRDTTVSEVGRFSEEVRINSNNNLRTLNPIFSFIDSGNILSNSRIDNTTAFGKHSIFDLLSNLGFINLNINLDDFVSTYLHYIEYKCNVPYRYNKIFNGKVSKTGSIWKNIEFNYFVRYLNKKTKWNRKKIESLLIKNNILNSFKRDDIKINWFYSKKCKEILFKKISQDINYLIT